MLHRIDYTQKMNYSLVVLCAKKMSPVNALWVHIHYILLYHGHPSRSIKNCPKVDYMSTTLQEQEVYWQPHF